MNEKLGVPAMEAPSAKDASPEDAKSAALSTFASGSSSSSGKVSNKQKALNWLMDYGAPLGFVGACYLLACDIRDFPACDSGTVVAGPDSLGYYDLLKCVDEEETAGDSAVDDDAFVNATLFQLEDDLVRAELYDDGLSGGGGGGLRGARGLAP